MSRSPLELVDAVLDEVEGLRRTDKRSFLPAALIRELREATAPTLVTPGTSQQCSSLDDLVGRTITHVFDSDLRRGDAVLMCADGGFVVLEAEPDGDSAYLHVSRGGSALSDYLRPRDLMAVGLMSADEKRKAEEQERIAKAEATFLRAQQNLKAAEAALAALKPAENKPAAPITEVSPAHD